MSSPGPLRAILMVGGSQVVNVVISIIRVKIVALLLGPSGIGLLGLLNNIKEVASTGGGLGLATSGVRQIARDTDNPDAQVRTRRVLLWGLIVQGAATALVVWLLRDVLIEKVFAGAIVPGAIDLIALAIWIGLAASAMSAAIQGMRRIADFARLTVIGALIGTALGLVSIVVLGENGLAIFVLALSVGQFLAAGWFLRRIVPSGCFAIPPMRGVLANWGGMVRLGLAFMVGALMTTASLLIARTLVHEQLGFDALGQFEAAWALTMTYIGFVLNAMSADYFPRLSSAIRDPKVANAMVNQQMQLALVLGGPLILVAIGLAPIILILLYSSEFTEATILLQWQSVGNILKLSCWAIGFTVVAAGRSRLFMLLQALFNLVFLGLVWLLLDKLGLVAIGVAFVVAYMLFVVAKDFAARRLIGFRRERASFTLQMAYTCTAVVLLGIVSFAPLAGAVASVVVAGIGTVLGLRFLLITYGTAHPVALRIDRLFSRIGWRLRRYGDD